MIHVSLSEKKKKLQHNNVALLVANAVTIYKDVVCVQNSELIAFTIAPDTFGADLYRWFANPVQHQLSLHCQNTMLMACHSTDSDDNNRIITKNDRLVVYNPIEKQSTAESTN
jgi:hypothetical protein